MQSDHKGASPDTASYEAQDYEARKDPRTETGFTRRTLIVVGIVALALAAWQLAPLLLLIFGGVLFAVLLRRLSDLLSQGTRIAQPWALYVVVALVVLVIGGCIALFGAQVSDQFRQLQETLGSTMTQVENVLQQYGLGDILGQLESRQGLITGGIASRITGMAGILFNAVAGILIIAFVSIYLAINPRLYRRGFVLLVPKPREKQVEHVLDTVEEALWRWMTGQFLSMVVIGVMSFVALTLLGVPMALVLALIAGLLEFIPVLGPWLAAIPAVLVGLSEGLMTAVWVGVAYFALQQLEGYLVLPLAERWAVALPPALTVVTTTAFTLLFGFVGLLFATPLTVAVIVMVRALYVRGTLNRDLGQDSKMPG